MGKFTLFAVLGLLGTFSTTQAAEQASGPGNNDRLAFADMGGIRDFRADGDRGIYIEGRNRQWYYASFMAPCIDLRFHDRVGFVLEPSSSLDRFSSILVGGQQCYFRSFEQTTDPDK